MSAVIKQHEMSDQLLSSHVAKWAVSHGGKFVHYILVVWSWLPQTPVHSGIKKNIIMLFMQLWSCNEEGKVFTSWRNKMRYASVTFRDLLDGEK